MSEDHSFLRGSAVTIALGVIAAGVVGFPPASIEASGIYVLFLTMAILQASPSVSGSSTLRIMGLMAIGYGVFILAFGSVGAIASLWIVVGVVTVVATRLYYR